MVFNGASGVKNKRISDTAWRTATVWLSGFITDKYSPGGDISIRCCTMDSSESASSSKPYRYVNGMASWRTDFITSRSEPLADRGPTFSLTAAGSFGNRLQLT